MNIHHKVDVSQVTKFFGNVSRNSKFGLVKALNKTGNDVQAAERAHIERSFTLRKRDYILRTVKIPKEARADTRTNKYSVSVMIDPERDVLAKFEKGGLKTPVEGKAIAIPEAVQPSKTGIIPQSRRPRALFASKKGLAGKVFSRGGLLLEKIGRGRGAITRVLYIWRQSIRIKPLLRFELIARSTIDKVWGPNAEAAVKYELDNLKR